ncbi:beta-lactamase/transpeptidase-like protein [Podospora conica]|nr:beta-lactamase/transpeptidase-like protein [Schizothecium conicum]
MAGQVPAEGKGAAPPVPADLPHREHHGSSQQDPGPFTPDFKRLVLSTLEEWHLPGLAMAVIDGDKTWLEGFGHATLSPPTPVTPTTLFMGGSTTKAFTAATVGLLLDRAPPPLSWKTPIAALLPHFATSSPWATSHLTLDDAVSHRSGLPRHDHASARWYPSPSGGRHAATPSDITRALRHVAFTQEPRTTFQYNNLMYVVLSECAEVIAGDGRSLGEMMREMIWRPLGMGDTFYGVEDLGVRGGGRRLATGYAWDVEEGGFKELRVDATPELAGAGLVISCVKDYAKWVRCWLEGGEGVMSREVWEDLMVPKMLEGGGQRAFDAPTGYACGWSVGSYKGHKFITHSGMMEAFGANIIFFPDDGFGVVALGNTAIEANAVSDVLLWRLVDDKFGVPQARRFDWAKKWRDVQAFMARKLVNPIDTIFPHRTPNPLPPSLPLEQYVGRYFHPGYQNMVVELGAEKGTLKADRSDFTWQLTAEFKHVSGEYWVMCARLAKAPNAIVFVDIAAVEFRVGINGKVESMGVEWRDTWTEGIEELVWYDRVD